MIIITTAILLSKLRYMFILRFN